MKKLTLTLLAAVAALAPAARASILTAGNFQTGTPTPTFSFGTPITLTITTTDSFLFLALDEWITTPDTTTTGAAPAPANQTISYRINGGAVQTVRVDGLVDNQAFTSGSLTPNDGYFQFTSPVAVTAGQTLTILPGTLTFATGGANFNTPPAVFNGNVFLFNSTGIAVSNLASANAVPEPSTWALLGVGAGGLGITLRQRRFRTA